MENFQMNEAQQEDLFIEWSLYEDHARKAMVNEYLQIRKFQHYGENFLDFLKEKLEIEGYWKKNGLA
jgi:hypothetical protein